MKKWWLILTPLFLMATVQAGDVNPILNPIEMRTAWTRTYSAADTIDGSAFRDTVYSDWYKIPAGAKFFFTAYVDGKRAYELGARDSAFALDSMNLNFQTTYLPPYRFAVSGRFSGHDANSFTTTNLGVLKHATSPADLDTTIAYAATLARDTVLMRASYVRAMVVVMDSAAAGTDRPSVLSQKFGRIVTLFLNVKP